MRKSILICIMLFIVMIMSSCSQSQNTALSGSIDITQEPTVISATEPTIVSANDNYEVREIWVENNGQKIYGQAYVPISNGKVPLVIHSHGLGSNHESGASYGKKYAPHGIAVYAFDFRGGSNSNNENRSDGKTTEMSVMTEVSDMDAILAAAKKWDFVDTNRIFLQGGSQGGLVAAISGVRHEDEIAGLLLHYPAFAMPDAIKERFGNDEIPEEMTIAGITLGKIFAEDLLSYDVRDDIPNFDKPVLILQGSADNIVLPSVTKAAADLYPDCEYHIIEGGEHGFSGKYHDKATEYGLVFIDRIIG